VTEGDLGSPFGLTGHAPALLLAVLDLLGHQHRLLVPRAEVRGLVMLSGAALDLLFLGQQALELRIGLLDQRRSLFDGLGSLATFGALGTLGTLASLG